MLALCLARVWPWRSIAGNEMDTVAAARQWAEPGWLPQDWYLNLDIPYRVPFNALVGPVSAQWGLGGGAAAGRLLSYALLAGAVVALLRALRINPWLALLPLAVFLGNQSLGAGEWMVGTAEAKALAYPAVLGSLAAVLARRPRTAAALAGAALSWHVLIGLMNLGALVAAVAITRARRRQRQVTWAQARALWPLPATGAWGLWVIWRMLRSGTDQSASAGWDVYVSFRVPHHALPSHWQAAPVLTWQVWLAGAVLTDAVLVWRGPRRWALVGGFTLAACALHVFGLVLAARGDVGLLRYYWFRLADTWIPLLAALLVAGALTHLTRRVGRAGVVAAAATALLVLPAMNSTRVSADLATQKLSSSSRGKTMQWVAHRLPEDAVVATDPNEHLWYPLADRAAWALYKSSPQSGADVLAWSRRLEMRAMSPSARRPPRVSSPWDSAVWTRPDWRNCAPAGPPTTSLVARGSR